MVVVIAVSPEEDFFVRVQVRPRGYGNVKRVDAKCTNIKQTPNVKHTKVRQTVVQPTNDVKQKNARRTNARKDDQRRKNKNDDEEDELERKEESVLGEWLRVLDDALVIAASAGESKQESKKELGEVRKGLKGWMRRIDEDGERLVERYLPRLITDQSTPVSTKRDKEKTEARFVKKFRWGVVDISNPDHCDFNPLKRAVFYHMEVCFVNNISF